MPFFRDSAELQEILGGFFAEMRDDPTLGPMVRAAGVQVTFVFTAPDLTVTIDGVDPPQQGGAFNIVYGPPPGAVPLQLRLAADTAHRFWQGQLNVILALAQQQIEIVGSAGRALALLPVVQPAFARYRAYLTAIGRPDLLT